MPVLSVLCLGAATSKAACGNCGHGTVSAVTPMKIYHDACESCVRLLGRYLSGPETLAYLAWKEAAVDHPSMMLALLDDCLLELPKMQARPRACLSACLHATHVAHSDVCHGGTASAHVACLRT